MAVAPHAEPWYHEGSDAAILVIHGFTGSPKAVRPWAQALAQHGWSVAVPRLPGHGTRWQDMHDVDWRDWLAEVDRELAELRKRADKVFVMGLSMGGTLTLRLAELHADISGIVLVNPSVHTERPDRHLLPILRRVALGWPGIRNDIAQPGQDEGAYEKISTKAAAALNDLWNVVRPDLHKVSQPTLIFQSTTDHVVEPSNVAYILDHVSSADLEVVPLERSYHVATLDYDAPTIFQSSADFVRRLAGA